MVNKLINYLKKYCFEILLWTCILFILLGALWNSLVGRKGTYAPNKYTIKHLHQKFPKSRPNNNNSRPNYDQGSSQGKKRK